MVFRQSSSDRFLEEESAKKVKVLVWSLTEGDVVTEGNPMLSLPPSWCNRCISQLFCSLRSQGLIWSCAVKFWFQQKYRRK